MATGHQANGICYESAVEARDAYFSSVAPVSLIDSSGNLQRYFFKYNPETAATASNWQFCYRVIGQDAVAISTTCGVPNYTWASVTPCLAPSESFNLGVEYGWYFVSVLVLAWGIHFCARMLK